MATSKKMLMVKELVLTIFQVADVAKSMAIHFMDRNGPCSGLKSMQICYILYQSSIYVYYCSRFTVLWNAQSGLVFLMAIVY